ncbi:hypothetical protein MMAD_41120 [Mycolicibacterium madagascariense]|uniref:Uncharacterized protein n=1 Tax=Mycolicibacterium madagascariense TaxID=212765 RepID=A0A7I7XKU7_9MYCO|nr:hypothetical protein [Mycolicibacterium madagascariense]MCV7014680.1 hypothetical protein [Mycolicibacterium madagascariense]BBZ29817.1 hypothetical protein MMAD_41120 [Mycolicibacterium madagascariense]
MPPTLLGCEVAGLGRTRHVRSSLDSYDTDKALDLWTTSERLVHYAAT